MTRSSQTTRSGARENHATAISGVGTIVVRTLVMPKGTCCSRRTWVRLGKRAISIASGGSKTKVPLPWMRRTWPDDASAARVVRTGARLTPNWSASSFSVGSRSPAPYVTA